MNRNNQTVPRFWALPESEANGGQFCEISLRSMDRYTRDFQAALELFDWCTEQLPRFSGPEKQSDFRRLINWRMLAARDGAMTIYHFAKAMQSANAWASKVPTIASCVEKAHLGNAFSLVRLYFPKFEAMRHAVAHAAELNRNTKAVREHSLSGDIEAPGISIKDSSTAFISSSLFDRAFMNTFEGQLITYDISAQTLLHLNEIKEEFYEAFRPLESR